MRIYRNFQESRNEIRRDLREMGIVVKTNSYQDKKITDDSLSTYELQNYIYTVTQPKLEDLNPIQPWADAEFQERLTVGLKNPGEAYILRDSIWNEFIQPDGRFAYTYSERIASQLELLISQVRNDPYSRQHFVSVWDRNIDPPRKGGLQRIPCSLGYIFQVRNGQLNITYLMRSCDFATHFENDVYLAHKLQHWLAYNIDIEVGLFTQYIASFHVFKRDVEGVF